jgi:hypothetical protein
MKNLFYALLFLTVVGSSFPQAGNAEPKCSSEAVIQARKLLVFHRGEDNRISINPDVKEIAPLKNPANPKQEFQVLEVWGYIYRASYRMRFIYYNSKNIKCLLMGQEILENSSL